MVGGWVSLWVGWGRGGGWCWRLGQVLVAIVMVVVVVMMAWWLRWSWVGWMGAGEDGWWWWWWRSCCKFLSASSEMLVVGTPGAARSRSVANLSVPVQVYREAVHQWLSTPPIVSLRQKVGPTMVFDARAVTPPLAVSLAPLLSRLVLDGGCASAVLQMPKLEAALRVELADNAVLRGGVDDMDKLELLVSETSSHVQTTLGVLRAIRLEDLASSSAKRFSKTSRFRRTMGTQEWAVLGPLISAITPSVLAAEVMLVLVVVVSVCLWLWRWWWWLLVVVASGGFWWWWW